MLVNRHKSSVPFAWRSALAWTLKIAVTLGLSYALYRQVFVDDDYRALTTQFARGLDARAWLYLSVAALLLPANLLLEALKFSDLLRATDAANANIRLALRRVLAGIAVGIFTPNRVGEYLGRLLEARPGERGALVAATFIGGLAQWLPLLLGGLLAGWFWAARLAQPPSFLPALLWAASVAVLGFGVSYLALPRVITLLARVPWLARRLRDLDGGTDVRLATRLRVLAYAALRYGVYLAQISLVFVALGLDVGWGATVAGTALMLLAQTFLPLPAVAQSLARTELGMLIWAAAAPNPLALGAASLFVFVLNLGLPALVGLGLILRSDVERSLT